MQTFVPDRFLKLTEREVNLIVFPMKVCDAKRSGNSLEYGESSNGGSQMGA